MVNLGQLIGGKNAKDGYFLEFKVHWGDIAKEILNIDSDAIHHMSMDDWKTFIAIKVKEDLGEMIRKDIKTHINKLIISLYYRQEMLSKEKMEVKDDE